MVFRFVIDILIKWCGVAYICVSVALRGGWCRWIFGQKSSQKPSSLVIIIQFR